MNPSLAVALGVGIATMGATVASTAPHGIIGIFQVAAGSLLVWMGARKFATKQED